MLVSRLESSLEVYSRDMGRGNSSEGGEGSAQNQLPARQRTCSCLSLYSVSWPGALHASAALALALAPAR